jgi:uncharacterized protein (TIGR02246 family)
MKLLIVVLALVAAGSSVLADQSDQQTEHEAAIRQNIDSYVAAFNAGDAESLAALWAENGVWISPSGDRIIGRAAIKEEMLSYFEDSRQQELTVRDVKLRFVAPTVVVEEGSARVHRHGEPPSDTNYVAIHVKEEQQWKLDMVREVALPAVTSNFEHLKSLEWMIGSWVDQDGEVTIKTTCRWTKNKNFMTRSFHAIVEDEVEFEGTQVVGFDAANQQIRSWVFDTDGGIGEGEWTQHGDRWIIKTRHTTPGGEKGSSVNIITYVDNDTFIWQSTGREMDGRLMPDIDPVTVVRE